MTKICSARWVLPIASGPTEYGAVAVEGTRIVGVGARAEVAARFSEASVEEFGEAVILAGFGNCHTHLELTAMRGYLEAEEGNFFAWLRKITVARNERMTPEDLYASAAWGAVEAARAGVTCVAGARDAGGNPAPAQRGEPPQRPPPPRGRGRGRARARRRHLRRGRQRRGRDDVE